MSGPIAATVLITAALFPFIAMPLLWWRMERVRDQAYDKATPSKRAVA